MAFDYLAFVQRELAKPSEPSKRSGKQKSGRTSRRQAHSKAALDAVGGTSNLVSAGMGGKDGKDGDPALCVIVDRKISSVTAFSQGSLYTVPRGQWMGRVSSV